MLCVFAGSCRDICTSVSICVARAPVLIVSDTMYLLVSYSRGTWYTPRISTGTAVLVLIFVGCFCAVVMILRDSRVQNVGIPGGDENLTHRVPREATRKPWSRTPEKLRLSAR